MNKKKIGLMLLSWLVMASGFAQIPNMLSKGKADSQECKDWVESRLEKMTLKEKIGQLFIHTVSLQDTEVNRKNIRNAVKEYKVGGFLFDDGRLVNQVNLTNYAQEMAEVPLLITFDGEWGLNMRLKEIPAFPRNRVLGCIQDNELLYEYGKEVARQFREIGVHVNFAPVADVDNNPLNPVINTRSFGGDVRNVTEKVIAYSKGLEDGGVLSVTKHFPGHGDTNVDSHKALPILNFSRERMDSIEMYPFRKAFEAGLGGVMVGHLEVPALSKRPASLSSDIIEGILQKEFGFGGMIFTDALEMKGVSNNQNVCAQALMAGNDMVLAPRNLKRELDAVLVAVKNGQLSEEQITERCRKVLTFKYALGLHEKKVIQMSGLENRLKRPETKDLLERLEKASVTIVGNEGGILPMDVDLKNTAVLQIGKSSQGALFHQQLKKYMGADRIVANPDSIASLTKRLMKYDRVIVTIYTEKYAAYQTMLSSLAAKKPVAYVYLTSLKNVYKKGNAWKKAAAVVLGHSDSEAVQRFVADVMMGREKATGRISVEVKDYRLPGEGVDVDLKKSKVYRPEDYGMDSSVLSKIDGIALEGIKAKAYPGCQILVLKDGAPVYDKCFGTFTYEDKREVTPDDLYDIASLTKTTATLLAVMKLYDEGKFGLTDPISKYVSALNGTRKGRITIEDLLYHQSGLPGSWPFYREAINDSSYTGGFFKARIDANHHLPVDQRLYVVDDFKYKEEYLSDTPSGKYPLQVAENMYVNPAFPKRMLEMIASDKVPLRDRRYRYSCLNFVLLKEMVEQISGMPMDEYLEKEFYGPMGMKYTLYNPLRKYQAAQIVPTIQKDYLRNRKELRGYVHDEIAAFMGGVSGNAGLFSNARDVAKVYQMLVDGGQYEGKRYLSLETCQLFMNKKSNISRRALGFDRPDPQPDKGPCADEAPKEVVGHTGFTGTCAWADPKNGLVFVFISNRIYPRPFDHKGLMTLKIRPRIQQLMYQALKK